MQLEFGSCYEAVRSRDPRFDGRFFTAVLTTGVYCRSICPARTPKPENVRFFACAAAAQDAGFRPCKRCQPQHAPGTPPWLGTADTVSRAMALLNDGFLDDHSLDELADLLHLTSRHLRRLFSEHLGTSPVAVAQTRRLHFSRQLLQQTSLSVIDTAMAAGFGSLRRFNESFRQAFGISPSRLREKPIPAPPGRSASGASWDFQLTLSLRPPFDWPGLLGFLSARAIPAVETVVDGRYRRTVRSGENPGFLEVFRLPGKNAVALNLAAVGPKALTWIVARVRRLFDLRAAPDIIAAQLSRDEILAPRLARRPGLRVPGAWSGFECAVRAILGQQVSVAGATTLAGRLVSLCGTPVTEVRFPGLTHVFPTPGQVAEGSLDGIGLPRARAEALRGLARAVATGRIDLEGNTDPASVRAALRELPGIGEWTVEYIAMRALADPDAFPSSDLGVLRALAADGKKPPPKVAAARAENWRPWRAYGAMLLWLEPDLVLEKRKGVRP
jgi:AraC family transcriptional regulator of adaptative response / DNA-3-methyladenine glycosylase II